MSQAAQGFLCAPSADPLLSWQKKRFFNPAGAIVSGSVDSIVKIGLRAGLKFVRLWTDTSYEPAWMDIIRIIILKIAGF